MVDVYAHLRSTDGVAVISTDVFDTVLLRDGSTETQRFAAGADRAARSLGVEAKGLRHLRWYAQEAAYKALSMSDPAGEVSLRDIDATIAGMLGLGVEAAEVLRAAEVDVDIEHLRANEALIESLKGVRAHGVRVIAVSDTIYSARDLQQMFTALLREDVYDEIYTSADLGRTKHDGGIFAVVAEREGVAPDQVLHVGDDPEADLRKALLAGWRSVHAPRRMDHRARRALGGLLSLPYRRARSR